MVSTREAPMDATTAASSALEVLSRTFGFPSFRGAQEQIIGHVAGGGDALVLMPTGGGKSLCYATAPGSSSHR